MFESFTFLTQNGDFDAEFFGDFGFIASTFDFVFDVAE